MIRAGATDLRAGAGVQEPVAQESSVTAVAIGGAVDGRVVGSDELTVRHLGDQVAGRLFALGRVRRG